MGVGLGMCIGFFVRGSFLNDNGNSDTLDSGGGGSDDSDDEGWDEVRHPDTRVYQHIHV